MTYHVTGLISAAIFLLTLGGISAQLAKIWRRKRELAEGAGRGERPTAVLSINQFVSSFLAFFSFFVYGACLDPLNHYLVWPRLAAALLTLAVLLEIARDRRNAVATAAFTTCAVLLAGASAVLALLPSAAVWGKTFSQGLILVITVILAQGYLHQVWLIRQTGTTGGISAAFHQLFLWKDISTVAFGLAMGVSAGWPILLLSSVSAATKIITLWHFRWVRKSPTARERRERQSSAAPATGATWSECE
jgi:hypothetical protein